MPHGIDLVPSLALRASVSNYRIGSNINPVVMITLTENDVANLVGMTEAIVAVRQAFLALADGEAMNVPRSRAKAPGIVLHNMHAAASYLGVVGAKLYTTTRGGAKFWVMIFSAESGQLVAMIEGDRLGQLRTGAASAVATDAMARPDAHSVGLFGTGTQARTQLEAVCAVRPIAQVAVYSRDPQRRAAFAEDMSRKLNVAIEPAEEPTLCVAGRDIIITATTSKTPLFDGRLIDPGTHLNIIGSNDLRKAEIDLATIGRTDRIVCDSRDACRMEAGDFVPAIIAGITNYESMGELAGVVAGQTSGRESEKEITLFKSVGLAIEDVALAHEIINRHRSKQHAA